MIIKETTIWVNLSNVRNTNKRIRFIKKQQIRQNPTFIDHDKIYVYKPKHQKGPAKEDQTFIVSFPYASRYDTKNDESEFINNLNEIGLSFYKEKCMFRTQDAYKIIIYENTLPIDILLQHTYSHD